MPEKYVNDVENKRLLDIACVACHQLETEFPTDESMKGVTVSVDAQTLHHIYGLLIAYAYTYEQFHCEGNVGCHCQHPEVIC